MVILEPVTMLTDYALAALCLWFTVALRRGSKLWVAAFLVTAIAALLGGTAHGFRVPLGDHWQRVWDLTWWSIAIGSVLLIAAGTRSAVRRDASSDGAAPGRPPLAQMGHNGQPRGAPDARRQALAPSALQRERHLSCDSNGRPLLPLSRCLAPHSIHHGMRAILGI